MLYVAETDMMLFLSSPSVTNLDDLTRRGLYLSDIALHDATRDLVLLSEQFEAEYKLTQNLEILTDKLQQTHRSEPRPPPLVEFNADLPLVYYQLIN